ncbi:MAG TPA: hypothetical protein VFC56_13020 [Stellaceae bacterium]|nr:hypothetical protein [Stellaceae bacterium]
MADDINLLVEYDTADKESWAYSLEITKIFVTAGIKNIQRRGNTFVGDIIFGVHMGSSFPHMNVSFIAGVFKKAQILVQVNKGTPIGGSLPLNGIVPNLYVFVGPKPLPAFEEWMTFNAERSIAPQSANDAFQRAAEVEERTAGRRLTAEQARIISEAMKGGTTVSMTHAGDDPEAFSFAGDIKSALEASGASVTLSPASWQGQVVTGLWVTPREGDSGEAERLMKALSSAGLTFTKPSVTAKELRMHVGHKPPE